jgi:IS30 family transposase
VRRNAATRSGALEYRATTAQWHAELRAKRPKTAKLAAHSQLRGYVQERLVGAVERPDGIAVAGPEVRWKGRRHGRRKDRRWGKAWSPEQIAHRLRVDFPDDESIRISHEAIYQALYVQGRGALRRELTACLRTGRALRVPRARTRTSGKGFVSKEILISERPAEAEDRAVPGHREGDLSGSQKLVVVANMSCWRGDRPRLITLKFDLRVGRKSRASAHHEQHHPPRTDIVSATQAALRRVAEHARLG